MTTHARRLPTHEAKREADFLSQRVLVREARKLVVELDLHICGSRLKRLVKRFVEEGRSDVELRTWLLSYADPTGETAVRHVMREQQR